MHDAKYAEPSPASDHRDGLASPIDPFVDALTGADRPWCTEPFETLLLGGTSILDLYQGLPPPALYRIGDLWADPSITHIPDFDTLDGLLCSMARSA